VTFGNVTKCHKMSRNVTLFQIFGTKLRLPFMFGFGSDRLSVKALPIVQGRLGNFLMIYDLNQRFGQFLNDL